MHPQDATVNIANQTVSHCTVDGIEDSVKKMVAEGATFLCDTADACDRIKVATLIDPRGNAVRLIEAV